MENEMFGQTPEEPTTPSRGKGILVAALVVLAAGNIYAIWQNSQSQSEIRALTSALDSRIASVNEQAVSFSSRADQNAAMLKTEVADAQQAAEKANAAATQARTQAERHAQQLVKQLADEYKLQNGTMVDELGNVRDSATQANQGVVAVKTDIHAVRNSVQQTQDELAATQAALKSTQGDLGVQSGLIATNSRELSALRQLGERDYHEFTITRDKEFHRVGNIGVFLKNTQPKHGKYTVDVLADDVRVEKKDRTINEPVQFYVSGANQPYELVVNTVEKGKITGYVAVPKVLRAAR